jgi:ankyrin repeat protein
MAVMLSQHLACRLLLHRRADVLIFDGQGECVWHEAAKRSSPVFLKLLWRFFRADVDIRTRPGVEISGEPTVAHAETALHFAAHLGSFECLRFLLKHGADRMAVES